MPNPYTTSAGVFISLSTGRQGIATYKASNAYLENQNLKAHFFGKDKILDLLNQSGAVGLRIWYGIGPDGNNRNVPQLYVVAVDANGDDILPSGNELVLDQSLPCPSYCPGGASLEN